MDRSARDRILAVALTLFVETGFDDTSTGEICRRAGVSNGSLFHFFPSKEKIAAALYLDSIADYQKAVIGALERARTPAAALRAVVLAQCAWVETGDRRARFLFTSGRDRWSADVAPDLRALNTTFVETFEAWRNNGVARMALRRMPVEAFIAILLGPSLMAIRAWLASGGTSPAEMAAVFARAAVQSLCREKRR